MQKSTSTKLVCIILFMAMTVYSAWSWFFQKSLYAVLIRLQSNHFDLYHPVLTGITMWLVLALAPLAYAYGGKSIHEYQLSHTQLARRLRFRTARIFLGVLIFGGLAAAAYQLSQIVPGDDQQLTKVDLTSDDRPYLWFKKVDLNGVSVKDSVVLTEDSVSEEGSTTFTRYIPIAPPTGSDQEIRFVESLTSDSLQRINRDPVAMTGFVIPKAVPVRVRDSFEQDGLRLSRYLYVISNNGFNGQAAFYIAAVILGLLTLILLGQLVAAPFQNRRKLRDTREHQGRW